MLSYRHAFHAGNHADVLKHFTLVQLLQHLLQKTKPFWYIDTHAGAGQYNLDGDYAQTNSEYETGISRLWSRTDLPQAVSDYVEIVRGTNSGGRLKHYPGSPQIALHLMRPQDRLRLFELHTNESVLLQQHILGAGTRALALAADGFAGLLSVLPPPTRRGLILVDPTYEDKRDYRRVVAALKEGFKRFATGVYAVWYPMVQRTESRNFSASLKRLCQSDWLHASIAVKQPVAGGLGLHGSGMFIVNPPFTLPRSLKVALPYLVRVLRQDDHAGYELEYELK